MFGSAPDGTQFKIKSIAVDVTRPIRKISLNIGQVCRLIRGIKLKDDDGKVIVKKVWDKNDDRSGKWITKSIPKG